MAETEFLRPNLYSRYSGDSDPAPDDMEETEIPWEEKCRALKDIIHGGKYPCLVKVKSGDIAKYSRTDERTDLDEVLQVLELRRHKMVMVAKLQWDRRSGEYLPTGRQSEINVTQKGWFEVLPDNGQPVEYFDTINAIVAIKPKKFLVRTSVIGFQLGVENGNTCWVSWEIRPGEILATGIVHMDQKKAKKKTILKRIFSSGKGSGKKEQDMKYLQCFDSEDREIMIPLITSGVFSPVGDDASPNYDAVYSLHDLISAFSLPMKAQLIHTDSGNYDGVPSGVLLLERLKDTEKVLVTRHPYVEGESETFEIPLESGISVIKEKRRKSKKQNLVNNDASNKDNELNEVNNFQIDLPVRVKDSKRPKSGGIFDKLSVRAKARKERASLKALQAEGIFSSRLSKSDLNFCDNTTNNSENNVENDSKDIPDRCDEMTEKQKQDLENGYSISTKRQPIQARDLPPIPAKTRSPRRTQQSDKESHYEELPVAPKPPSAKKTAIKINDDFDDTEHIDDGYMTPARFKELNESQTNGDFDIIVKKKPPTAPRDSLRYTRARKVKSEYSQLPPQSYDTDQSDNIDSLFDFTEAEMENGAPGNVYDRRRKVYAQGQFMRENSRDGSKVRSYYIDDNRRFNDDSALESKSLSGFMKIKSRSQKSLNNVESNATIRSHNVRKMKTAMEVFNFSDSMRDLREPFENGVSGNGEPTYGRVIDDERIKSYVYGQQNPYSRHGRQYVESEPAYRKFPRSVSNAALSDTFPKHGDDSAISCGEYGFHGESEYSYSEYSEWQDDGWIPPDDITSLSVLEISKSLRYIGMKDRVVIRFAREQIDGNMLCSLDKKLLKEGFPELNALDIKKVMDFIGGWRPKK